MSYFSLGDEDEDDGGLFGGGISAPVMDGPRPGGNLGSLFGGKINNPPSSNQSLQYKAPKPPKPESQEAEEDASKKKQKPSSSSVIAAVAVNAFRLVNNQYTSQGKLGAALLGSHEAQDYKILMYVTKQQPVTTATVTKDFTFNVLSDENNYATFTDDLKQTWSISFDSKEKLFNFSKQICLCKFYCNSNEIAIMDLMPADAALQALAVGDSVEVKYTGWLVVNKTLGNVFDSNHNSDKTFRFKSGKGKVIKGWDTGMLGMRKGGKRFIVIPSTLAYGNKAIGNKVPANSTLAFEVDVLRIKFVNEIKQPALPEPAPETVQHTVQESPSNVPTQSATEQMHPGGEMTVKDRAASLDEHSAVPGGATDKAKLMSRMAKVGHAMLPQQPVLPHQQAMLPQQHQAIGGHVEHVHQQPNEVPRPAASPMSVSSNPVQSPAHAHAMPSVSPVTYMQHPQHEAYQTQQSMHQPAMVFAPQPSTAGFSPQQAYPSPGYGGGMELLPALVNESRQHGNDLRHIQNQLDKVSDKMDEIKNASGTSQSMPSYTMDATMISHSISRILKESENLKSQIENKDKHIEHQNNKISELMQQNQKYMEKSHQILEQNHDSFKQSMGQNQAKNLQHEEEKMRLTKKISEATSEISDLHLTLSNVKEIEKELRQKLHKAEDALKSRNDGLVKSSKDLQKQIEDEQSKNSLVQKKVKVLEEQQSSWRKEKSHLLEDFAKLKAEKESIEAKNNGLLEQLKHSQNESATSSQWEKKLNAVKQEMSQQIDGKNVEIEEVSSKLEILQNKFIQLRNMYTTSKETEASLNEQLEEATVFQQKYEHLRDQATMMKQKYERKIRELMQELKEKNEEKEVEASVAEELNNKIKSVMNAVFLQMREKISADEDYSGSQVLSVVLSIIKAATLNAIKNKQDEVDNGEESKEEEEKMEEGDKEEQIVKMRESEKDNEDNKEEDDVGKKNEEDNITINQNENNNKITATNATEEDKITEDDKTSHQKDLETEHKETETPSKENDSEDKHSKDTNEELNSDIAKKEIKTIIKDKKSASVDHVERGGSPSSLFDEGEKPPPLGDEEDESEDDSDWLK